MSRVAPTSVRYRIVSPGDDLVAHWDEFLQRTSGGSFRQTSQWASLKALQGWRARLIVVADGEQIVGGAQLLWKPLPVIPYIGGVGYCAKAPISSEDDPVLLSLLLDELRRVCRALRVRVLVIQPPEDAPGIGAQLTAMGCTRSPLAVAPEATAAVRLALNLDAVMAGLAKRHRQAIRQTVSRGVTVRRGSRHDLDEFHRLLTEASMRLEYSVFPLDYYRKMWDLFTPDGQIQLFLAEYKGEVLSAQLCLAFGDTVRAMSLGWSGRRTTLAVNDLLDWEAIKWAVECGASLYDLENLSRDIAEEAVRGLDSHSLKAKAKGSDAYKLKWCTDVLLFPLPYLYLPNPVLRALMNLVPERWLRAVRPSLRNRAAGHNAQGARLHRGRPG